MSIKITDDKSDWDAIKHEIDILNRYMVVIGFWGNDRLIEIVSALEYGADIKPHKADGWLIIPSKNDELGEDGLPMSSSEWDEKHPDQQLFRPGGKKGAHVLAVKDASSDTGFKIIFYLMKEVKIPSRPFLRKTSIEYEQKYIRLTQVGVQRVFEGRATGKGLLDLLGHTAVSDIQHEMRTLYKPGNAPMTIDNKGFNNPLIGKRAGGQGGALINKITYKIIPK